MWCAASAMGWTIWGLIPGSAQDFPRLQNVYSCSWAQPASYSVGTKSSCWRGNVCHELRTLPCRCCENKWTRYSHNIVTCPASAVSIASSVNYQLEGSTFNITSPGAQLCTLDETKKKRRIPLLGELRYIKRQRTCTDSAGSISACNAHRSQMSVA